MTGLMGFPKRSKVFLNIETKQLLNLNRIGTKFAKTVTILNLSELIIAQSVIDVYS